MNSFLNNWLPNLATGLLYFVLAVLIFRQQLQPWVLRTYQRLRHRKAANVDTMPSLQEPFVNGYWSRLDAVPPGRGTSLRTMIAPHGYRPSIYNGTSESDDPWG